MQQNLKQLATSHEAECLLNTFLYFGGQWRKDKNYRQKPTSFIFLRSKLKAYLLRGSWHILGDGSMNQALKQLGKVESIGCLKSSIVVGSWNIMDTLI